MYRLFQLCISVLLFACPTAFAENFEEKLPQKSKLSELSSENFEEAKAIYKGLATEVDGFLVESGNRAFINLYGEMNKTNKGLCFRTKLSMRVDIVSGHLDWKPLNPPWAIRPEFLVWFPPEGLSIECEGLSKKDAVTTNTFIEQNTLLRLHRQAAALLLEAGELDRRFKIPENIGQVRVETINL